VWRSIERACAGLALAVAACSGGGGGSAPQAAVPPAETGFLARADVERIVAQAAGEATARGVRAHIAVVDRVGNVLAVFRMTGAGATAVISSGRGVRGGLEEASVPAELAAIAKAVTGAYLSSNGNAFSTRTAGQIVQEHFNPNEAHQPSGPLYGVQFSQLSCSDVNRNLAHGSVGPKRSPLGLSADPGGLPLYKDGVLAGGIGVEADGRYSFDRDITDVDENPEELIALAGTSGFDAPVDIRADRITADGRTFRFVDAQTLRANPQQAPSFTALGGSLVAVAGYSDAVTRAGTAFGTAASGIRAEAQGSGTSILVDAANANRFPARDGEGGLRAHEVRAILDEALVVARRARGQIRRPLGSFAHVTVSVVDRRGDVLGLARTSDAPVFGIDVAVQKARTALAFSHESVMTILGAYAQDFAAFVGDAALGGRIAFTPRSVGNLHRPFYPDGLENAPRGPLSTPIGRWSPFNVGFQLDLVAARLVAGLGGDLSEGCAASPLVRNGVQIFPGGVPIYRGDTLVGAIGVSGDGVDQDDMVAYLGVRNAARLLATGIDNAPASRRADTLAPLGVRLRYVQCPQAPFNDSSEQNACE
jgi:uncharacterized protein GlcG (DUF336 family)